MPKNKDPAVLFYTSDFLVGVMCLTMEERGQYITLLCLQHQRGHLTKKEMEFAVGKVSPDVMAKFTEDADGKYYNEVMDGAIEQRKNYIDSRRKSSHARFAKKANDASNGKTDDTSYDTSYDDTTIHRSENENVNENTNKDNTSDTTFSFSNTTNKQTNKKKTYKEKLTDAELKEYGVFKVKVIHHFADNHFESDPLDFIRYNEERNWIGGYGENVREHWLVFAEKWELAHVNRQNEIETRKEIKDDG